MAIEATPEGVLPLAPSGPEAVTETVKLVDVVCVGSEFTVLVGGVVSINHEVKTEPAPGPPYVSSISAALTVRLYVPSAVVREASPLIW
jgi:hypothetical protein